VVRPVVALRRVVGPLLPKMEGRNEQSSPVCSTKGSGPIVQRALAAEPRGAREAVGRRRLPRDSRSAGGPSAADTVSVDAEDAGIELTARADSRSALGSRDCGAVGLLSTQIVRKQAKAIISNDASHCMSRRRQRFPTVRMSRSLGKRRSLSEDVKY
jgi:hypothetical protein